MITIGLTGFTDHPELLSKREGLAEYAQTFPVVEIDSSAYGVPLSTTVTRWLSQVPRGFRFIVKATQTMTRHHPASRSELIDEFARFDSAFTPMLISGQLQTILFQFPPMFAATPANVRYLAQIRTWLPEVPLAVEFRHTSWFTEAMRASTLEVLRDNELANMVVDEPQTPTNSVPFLPVRTAGDTLYVRLHGRNQAGWLRGERAQRTNYDYSDEELGQLAAAVAGKSDNTVFIFNNNAGHAAARNALRLRDMLNLEFDNLAPQQLDLF
ncbi:DUF72 domain-containing protein [Lacticaseibacillus hulanensis]|uniref:DUF72 domain-containing protein n=1 Tax=Lacticaseibacillus hulanensis TaxID=2493111 RepID=UPI000FD9FD56|nr:DUF72 domain-containing protein [Lacticaseibacillus hulanensis]